MGGCEARPPYPPRTDRSRRPSSNAEKMKGRNGARWCGADSRAGALSIGCLDDAELHVGLELVAAIGGPGDRRGITVADEALVRMLVEPGEPGGEVARDDLDPRQPQGIEAAREGRLRGPARHHEDRVVLVR